MTDQRGILFTAFEPSGDELAARLICAMKQDSPQRPIYALGGPLMQQAGAEIIELTTDRPAMLGGAAKQVLAHRQRLKRLKSWLKGKKLAALVPTDSPAANWSICKLIRKHQPTAKIVHLVAPQLWAWAPWRIGRLRRLSDHVMCLFPFEPKWFSQRGVTTTFVGHPLFENHEVASPASKDLLPTQGEPKLALLPGSRSSEIKANWPAMLGAYEVLSARYPQIRGVVAASNAACAQQLAQLSTHGRLPDSITIITAETAAVFNWADVALVKSGTSTLQCLAHGTPMVIVYCVSRIGWHLAARWLLDTRTFGLPNLIAQSLGMGIVIPELVPHFGKAQPLVAAIDPLMKEGEHRAKQRAAFVPITEACGKVPFSATASATLLNVIGR